ncbi:SRPBCC family protein [Pseudarthrobacter phenanthrenivorans]|uniref:SRPBCC family protein n=1 Tax=Pseudarthrobacter phenanthrenivorans TaxID=361575 RepID=UPI0011276E35|nr:SRPBCC family protein [Pseudarthrobacter phenanthrenivorans]TPV47751.1 SRPBCC family protein [Pseudarthrobacter phenanthrenivorans]
MKVFLRFLPVVVIVGVPGILVLAAVADAAGNPQLGFGMIAGLFILLIALSAGSLFFRFKIRQAARQYHQAAARGVRAPGRTLRVEEAESYPCDAESVWSLIRSAESAVLLETATRAFTVPGTPTGVGEQQSFIRADGSATTIEVVEEEAPYWAKTVTVAPSDNDMVQTYRIEPSESGCTLRMSMTATIPAVPGYSRLYEKEWRKHMRRYLERVKENLASEAPRHG